MGIGIGRVGLGVGVGIGVGGIGFGGEGVGVGTGVWIIPNTLSIRTFTSISCNAFAVIGPTIPST